MLANWVTAAKSCLILASNELITRLASSLLLADPVGGGVGGRERGRERERESVCVCVKEREKEKESK